MNIKPSSAFLSCAVSLSLLLLVSCGSVTPAVTETSLPTTTFTPAYGLTLTAEAAMTMGETSVVIPSFTPPSGVTVLPAAGDLGWGAVHGKVVDANTGLPVEGAVVKCQHSSYTSASLCKGVTTTNSDGLYVFLEVFFHDTDRITLSVEAPGYAPLHFEQSFFTQPDLRADLKLFPSTGDTPTPTMSDLTPPTPFLMCTAPACPGGDLVCGKSDGCLGGCGTICLTATSSP